MLPHKIVEILHILEEKINELALKVEELEKKSTKTRTTAKKDLTND